ncbi:MAG TPA: ATP-binding protein [Candidatus Limnocylindrales bacterium]|nr:ATP-binding protein [Candidatus Limnocylindrales bacterium]
MTPRTGAVPTDRGADPTDGGAQPTRSAQPTDGDAVTASERRRIFEDAQRQADSVFAQYQLSQLVALGGELRAMAASVIVELVRVTDAVAGALWLAAPDGPELTLYATEPVAQASPDGDGPIPGSFASAAEAGTWVRESGWHAVTLDERRELGEDGGASSRTAGVIALRPPDGSSLPPDRVRLLALVRHELAIAFRAAQLRETLAGEQALLAAILDGANDGIVAVDEDRRIVRVNRAARSLLGDHDGDGPITCRELLGCDDGGGRDAGSGAEASSGSLRCGPRCRFEEVLEGPSGIVDAELRLRRDDGSEVPVAASFSAMAGREPGAVVVLRDLRAELAADELRTSFLAAVSHELRTPLALIGGYVDSLLGLELDPATQRRSVERIGQAAARLNLLVDELLDLTRLEHASMGLRRSRVDLASLLAAFTRDLGESPGMPAVHVAVPSDLPLVDADSVRIGHVLANLVDNARKYGGEGPVTITARRARGMVVVTVTDTGPGIAPDERTLVFDRFYRGRATRDGGPRGSGLGLYVCRRLVEAHGGEIWVEPEDGRSAISFSLPAARQAPPRSRR